MYCFLKVLTTFYKEISEIISTILMKDRYKYEDKKREHINSKSSNLLTQHDLIRNCSFIYQKKFFLLFYSESEENKSFFVPIFKNNFFLIVTVIIIERFNIHFRITWTFSYVILSPRLRVYPCQCSTSLLLSDNGSKVSQLQPSSSIILKIFSRNCK